MRFDPAIHACDDCGTEWATPEGAAACCTDTEPFEWNYDTDTDGESNDN
jgi:hypothetical protein